MSELKVLADCQEPDVSQDELRDMLEQVRRQYKEARFRAEKESIVIQEVSAQRHKLSMALMDATKSLNQVMEEQEKYRLKEVSAALAAKRLKQAITEANEQNTQIRAAHDVSEEKRKLAESKLAKTMKNLEKTSAKCEELEMSLVSLVDECSSAREQNFAASSSAQEKHQALSDLDANHKALSNAHAVTEAMLQQHKLRTEELEAELKQQKVLSYSAVSSLETRLDETTTQLKAKQHSVSVLEGSVLKLADELSQLTTSKVALSASLKEQTELLATTNEALNAAKSEHAQVLASLQSSESSMTDLEAELKQQKALSYSAVSSFETRLDETTTQLKLVTQERDLLQSTLQTTESKVEKANHMYSQVLEQLNTSEEELRRLGAEVESGNTEQISLVRDRDEEKRRSSLVSKQLSRVQQDLDEANTQCQQWKAEEKEARELAGKLAAQLSKVETVCEQQQATVESAALMEAELSKVRAFQASFSQHSARAQQLELLVAELTTKCEDQQKQLNSNPEVLKLRKELASSQKKEKAHASALDDALASIASMQERAAIAQRRVWQGKVTALQEKLKTTESSLEASNKRTKELEALANR
mmetsp:Transcript_26053/g.30854  ORF Transcript_26053/g.30854 Transcript_26053/m.30854 type:complete len:591 (-) Transcript_26053:4-1776(-)